MCKCECNNWKCACDIIRKQGADEERKRLRDEWMEEHPDTMTDADFQEEYSTVGMLAGWVDHLLSDPDDE